MNQLIEAIEAALVRRKEALLSGRFAEAAGIVDYLSKLNVRVTDTAHGVYWQIV